MTDFIEVNGPFKRVPCCPCDDGNGTPPTTQKMLECRIAGGFCSSLSSGVAIGMMILKDIGFLSWHHMNKLTAKLKISDIGPPD